MLRIFTNHKALAIFDSFFNCDFKMKVLILCTGNSCRSQIAEGFLKSFDPTLQVFSAGTNPASEVHPMAIAVMKEEKIDLTSKLPQRVEKFLNQSFDYVITVCDEARESCPVFSGKVKNKIHMGFEDPAKVNGTHDEVLAAFRRIRDEIKIKFYDFYLKNLKSF